MGAGIGGGRVGARSPPKKIVFCYLVAFLLLVLYVGVILGPLTPPEKFQTPPP